MKIIYTNRKKEAIEVCTINALEELEDSLTANGWSYEEETDCIVKTVEKKIVGVTGKTFIDRDTIRVGFADLLLVREMHYADYKRSYTHNAFGERNKTGNYNADTKTIEVYIPLYALAQ